MPARTLILLAQPAEALPGEGGSRGIQPPNYFTYAVISQPEELKMRKSALTIILIFCLTTVLLAQQPSSIGANFAYAYRLQENPEIWSKIGISLGLTGRIAVGSPILMLTAGARYVYFPEGYEQTGSGLLRHDAYDLFTPFFGLQLGRASGPYLVVAETGDFGEKETRFGIDAGIGYQLWEGPARTKFDASLKYCLANLMGKDDGEKTRSYLLFSMGFAF